MRRRTAFFAIVFFCSLLDACGSRVSGHIYHNNGGVVQVEFKSDGKAYVYAGPSSRVCSYSETGEAVSLVCNGNTTKLTMQDDGALVGPAEGVMARLTPVKN